MQITKTLISLAALALLTQACAGAVANQHSLTNGNVGVAATLCAATPRAELQEWFERSLRGCVEGIENFDAATPQDADALARVVPPAIKAAITRLGEWSVMMDGYLTGQNWATELGATADPAEMRALVERAKAYQAAAAQGMQMPPTMDSLLRLIVVNLERVAFLKAAALDHDMMASSVD